MLKPYFIIAFMVTALSSLTTLMVAQTFMDINNGVLSNGSENISGQPPAAEEKQLLSSTQLFAIGISAQSWMTGFLVGKIGSGSFATGFRYAIMLLAISTGAMVMTQEFNISPSTFLNPTQAGST